MINEVIYCMQKRLYLIAILLAILLLPLPILWLKIGPAGHVYYGPNVPDIYILGGDILGKDKGFEPINWASKFQLGVILYFIVSNLLSLFVIKKQRTLSLLAIINTLLLLLFPFWLYLYTYGVIGNSDGADISVILHVGAFLYIAILILYFILLINRNRPS